MMPFSYATEATMSAILHDCRFGGGISASGQSAGFGGNLFTRDTLRVLRDVMGIPGYQSFIREMLGILPQWQGTREDSATNEFPDALSHQVFRSVVGGRYLPSRQVNDMRGYAHEWNIPMTSSAKQPACASRTSGKLSRNRQTIYTVSRTLTHVRLVRLA
ncbi:MAG: hypothetical protein EOO17_05900 [Chloroflexi bacterium]|nr:MAG: hypothetical protein EOO17_05900 [Chloroflexota bacterium]